MWRKYRRSLESRHVLKHLQPHRITVQDDEVEFRYAWRNGVWHCLEPVSLDLSSGDSIREKAHRWLGQIMSVKDAADWFKVYLLLGEPQQEGLRPAFDRAVSILHKLPVYKEIVREESATGKVRSRLRPKIGSHDTGMLFAAVFDPDGQMLMTAANRHDGGSGQPDSGVISLWNAKNGRFPRELKAPTNGIEALAISGDGKTLAVAHHLPKSADQLFPGCALSLVDLETDSVRGVLRFSSDVSWIFSVAFSANDRKVAAAGSSDFSKGTVNLWDVASGRCEQSLNSMGVSPVQPESQVAFSPDGNTLAIAGNNTTVLLWDVPESKWRSSLSASSPPSPGHYAMQFVNGGLLLGRVNDFQQVEVTLWDYPRSQPKIP